MALEPITRAEQIMSGESLEPITREEMFLAKAAGMDVDTPEPITRREMFLSMIQPGDGSGATIRNQNKTITENGQYKADSGYTGLGTVTVAVPETEPVLQDKELTENGTYTADEGFDGLGEVVVNVPGNTAPVVEPLTVTENGTYTATSGVYGYNPVTVNVGRPESAIEFVEMRNPSHDYAIHIRIYGPVYDNICYSNMAGSEPSLYAILTTVDFVYWDSITRIGRSAFRYCQRLEMQELPPNVVVIDDSAFNSCSAVTFSRIPKGVRNIGNKAFAYCTSITSITFEGTPGAILSDAFYYCTNLLTINVPWAEGEVANAPWGATNATINYNYTGG